MTETNTLSWHSLHCTLLDYSQQQSITQNTTTQAGWFLRPDCAPSSERPQFRMPRSFDRCTPPRRRFNQNIPPSVVLLQQCHCRNRHRGKLQNLPPPSVLFESSRIFFTIHRRHRCKKWWTRILTFKFCDFWDFLKFSKRCCALRPIWTIMVAAKLDQSRVLVTKFHQYRLTLKGISASQRYTHRQTNSAENNGPSGLQSSQHNKMQDGTFTTCVTVHYCLSLNCKDQANLANHSGEVSKQLLTIIMQQKYLPLPSTVVTITFCWKTWQKLIQQQSRF